MEKKNKTAPKYVEILTPVLSIAGACIVAFCACSAPLVASADGGYQDNPNGYNEERITAFSGCQISVDNGQGIKYATHTFPLSFSFNNTAIGDTIYQLNPTWSALLPEQTIAYSEYANTLVCRFDNLYANIYHHEPSSQNPDLRIYNPEIRSLTFNDYISLIESVALTEWGAVNPVNGSYVDNFNANLYISWSQEFYNIQTDTFEIVDILPTRLLRFGDTLPRLTTDIVNGYVERYAYTLVDNGERMLVLGDTLITVRFTAGSLFDYSQLRKPYVVFQLYEPASPVVNLSSLKRAQDFFDLKPDIIWGGEVGLFEFVDEFLTTEWFPGFSFSTLLVIMFGCLLVGAVLKIFLGG